MMEGIARLQRFLWVWLVAFAAASGTSHGGLATMLVEASSSPSWTIYHSWNGGKDYTRRGLLEWKEDLENGGSLVVTNDEDHALTKEEVQAMLDFGWYSVKIDTRGGEDFVMATVPACSLRRANFKDEFAFTFPRLTNDDESDTAPMISSLAYTPLISSLAPPNCDDLDRFPQLAETGAIPMSSRVQASVDTPGMTIRPVLPTVKGPPGMKWLAHPNARKGSAAKAPSGGSPGANGGAGEEEKDNRPFFIKYWYIVLPLALANFLPADQPPPQGAEGTSAGAVAGAAAAGAATATAASAPTGKQRRGKRS